MGFPGNSVGKESACNAGHPGSTPGLGRSPREGIGYPLQYSWASLMAQANKESACIVGDLGSISGLGRSPGGGHGNPLQYSCLVNPHGQRSLAGYSLWGHKEWDTIEQLSIAYMYVCMYVALFPYSYGDQKTEIKVWSRPHSLKHSRGYSFLASSSFWCPKHSLAI